MAKLTLSDLASLANETSAISTINANNSLIETALENTLSRDGTSPNTMSADLDMNDQRIMNVQLIPLTDAEAATKYYVDAVAGLVTDPIEVEITDLTILGDLVVGDDISVTGDFTSNIRIVSTNPSVTFTDTSTGADSQIDADSTTGSIAIEADINNEVASSVIGFNIDGTSRSIQDTTSFRPSANDGIALGTTSQSFSDLFLASGAVINFNAGDVTITHAADLLTIAGGVVAFSSRPTGVQESFVIACSDETSPITAGTAKVTFRMPYAFTVTAVRASLTTAQASGNIFTVDINENGTTILSTKLTIDNTEETSTTAATAAVISDTALADDAEITIDVDQIGNGSATGLKVTIIGFRP